MFLYFIMQFLNWWLNTIVIAITITKCNYDTYVILPVLCNSTVIFTLFTISNKYN